jgi:2-hydroxychromene-2-carboxylate isomerase
MKISWVFDVISPYAHIGLKQLARLPDTLEIDYVPVLFAGLLDHHGQTGPAEIASKRRFTYRFVLWRARKLGLEMQMPPTHPFNPLQALRLIIACGATRRAIDEVFDAVWKHGRDVADPEVIADIAAALGLDDAHAAIAQPPVKQKLRENTEWAIARGVFGVPTIVAHDELFWGQDALEMVLDYLGDPELFEDARMRAIENVGVGAIRARSK